MSELGKFSPQHRGGLDAGDTDSVDLTSDNHGPHRMMIMIVNKRQTSVNMVAKYFHLTRQTRPQRYPKAVFTRATFGLFVARHRDWRRRPTHKPLSRRLSAEVEHVPILAKK